MSDRATTFSVVLGQVICQLRTVRGIPQAGLGNLLGLGQSVVSRIESGVIPLTVDNTARIARILDLRPSELLARVEAGVAVLEKQGVRVLYGRPPFDTLDATAVGALIALSATKDGP